MAAVGDASQLRKGTISKIFPTKDLDFLSSIHMYVNGSDIIKFGRKVRTVGKVNSNGDQVEVNGCWIATDERNCIPGKIKRAFVKRLNRNSGLLKLMDSAKPIFSNREGSVAI
jgi:hypothetical protein